MALTRGEVRKVAHLARLELSEAEVQQYQQELSRILDYVTRLDELHLAGVPPTAHAVPLQNVVRDDDIVPSLPLQLIRVNAPLTSDGQFLIQRVLKDD
jgi:aspartyl-tRNA(Asn)/glutamyl-tRNA(Gln) amidotransferase subunit C